MAKITIEGSHTIGSRSTTNCSSSTRVLGFGTALVAMVRNNQASETDYHHTLVVVLADDRLPNGMIGIFNDYSESPRTCSDILCGTFDWMLNITTTNETLPFNKRVHGAYCSKICTQDCTSQRERERKLLTTRFDGVGMFRESTVARLVSLSKMRSTYQREIARASTIYNHS